MGRRSTGTVEPLKSTIRIKYTWNGARRVETLDLVPTPANIKAAQRIMGRMQDAIRAGVFDPADFFDRPGARSVVTLHELADTWLASKTGAKSTLAGYRKSVAFWKEALEDAPIGSVKHSDLLTAIAAKRATVSGKTINNHLIVIRGIFSLAEADELIARNPAEKIKQQPHQSPAPDPFDRDEMEAILAHLARRYPEPVANYFEFAFCTGMRPSELISVRWGDVDWNKAQVRVQRASVLWEEKDTKTHTIRDVDLTDRALAALTRQKAFTFMRGADAPIFCNPVRMKPWADEQRQRRAYFHPTLRALGIRMRDAYNTRHTYATMALMAGVAPAYIARQLGHSTTAMLFRVYSRWIDGADKGAEAAKLNGVMSTNRPRTEGAR